MNAVLPRPARRLILRFSAALCLTCLVYLTVTLVDTLRPFPVNHHDRIFRRVYPHGAILTTIGVSDAPPEEMQQWLEKRGYERTLTAWYKSFCLFSSLCFSIQTTAHGYQGESHEIFTTYKFWVFPLPPG